MKTEVKEIELGIWSGEVEFRHKAGSLEFFGKDSECRGFWRLSLGNGCPLQCGYCFLSGTFSWLVNPVVYDDQTEIKRKVQKWLAMPGELVLNSGELSDSLLWNSVAPFAEYAVPLFEEQNRHVLLLLTKTAHIDGLLKVARYLSKPIKQTIVSWSVNCEEAAKRFEGIAPSPRERLMAARLVQEAGYRVRLRIDPMMPIEGWQEAYSRLVEMIRESGVTPERVTLGSLRFLPRTAEIVRRKAPELLSFTTSFGDGRWRVGLEQRMTMYKFMEKQLGPLNVPVALCKETEEFRRVAGLAGPCHCMV